MNHSLIIGLDIGGTKIEATLVNLSTKEVLDKKRLPTERQKGYEQVLEKIKQLLNSLVNDQVTGIGVGLPGSFHPTKKVMLTGNTALFVNRDLEKDLRTLLPESKRQIPILFDNDANCFALAETYLGAGLNYYKETGISPEKHNALGVIIGTGCGTGIIIQGTIWRGRNGGAGEAGHTELITGGLPCYCGRNGCAEQYLSGPALEASFNRQIYSQIEKRPSAKEIFELYHQEDPIAIAVVRQYQRHLAKFIGNLNNTLDLDYYVLGGGLSQAKIIYEGLEDLISQHSFIPNLSPKIYCHALSDAAGSLGAALLFKGI